VLELAPELLEPGIVMIDWVERVEEPLLAVTVTVTVPGAPEQSSVEVS